MWEMLGWAAWVISAAIFIGLGLDFLRTNAGYSEDVLLSSREGVDELFGSASQAPGE